MLSCTSSAEICRGKASRLLPGSRSTTKYPEKTTTPSDLIAQGYLSKFGIFLNYYRALRFDNEPDYLYSGSSSQTSSPAKATSTTTASIGASLRGARHKLRKAACLLARAAMKREEGANGEEPKTTNEQL